MQTRPQRLRRRLLNAAHWAHAAYVEPEGSPIRWQCHTSSGILHFKDGHLIVGITGSDQSSDIWHDLTLYSRSMDEWSVAADIKLAEDSKGVVTTTGFLDHTANAYEGIMAKLRSMGVDQGDITSVSLSGHSLGGAVAYLLQHTEAFGHDSRAYVFGCPKVYKRGSRIPERLRSSCWKHNDIVTYGPWSCVHPSCQDLILTYPGQVPRTEVPGWLRVPMASWVLLSWVYGAACELKGMCGDETSYGLFKSHSMTEYLQCLEL